ncbi:hypothetical protein CMI44_02560 [Candidatus Pacearchaeota archaeon]|jgi:inner membrane protein|nr:hypothetical protein [Candidatus Pacearchaeota archaeon]|tara:strand:- start:218 stop:670 length:453 start_codon:yes stop_codon:yes gene_type:complete
MLIRTHLVITSFFVLLFLPYVEGKLAFAVVALIAAFLPDVDSRFATIGRRKIARILQVFTKHRGVIHSFTFLMTLTFLLIIFYPRISLGFFLGYSLHLLADSFTPDGIKPFYPSKKKSTGIVPTGGKREMIVLVFFIIANLVLLGLRIFD